jgi:hypothetical protein
VPPDPDPPVFSGPPWVDMSAIRAATARDVLERVDDDRSLAERRAQGARALAAARLSRPPVFKFGAQACRTVTRSG